MPIKTAKTEILKTLKKALKTKKWE